MGGEDFNVNTEYHTERLITTTNTSQLAQTYELDGTTTAVPEPGTLSLLGLGLVAWRRRRQRT